MSRYSPISGQDEQLRTEDMSIANEKLLRKFCNAKEYDTRLWRTAPLLDYIRIQAGRQHKTIELLSLRVKVSSKGSKVRSVKKWS